MNVYRMEREQLLGYADAVKLRYNFNYVLKEKQIEVIENIIAGNDTFAMLPTGFGKSVCYILPPLILDVVSTMLCNNFEHACSRHCRKLNIIC